MQRIPVAQWIAWIAATAVAALTMATYVYGFFESKEQAQFKFRLLYNELSEMKKDVKEIRNHLREKK